MNMDYKLAWVIFGCFLVLCITFGCLRGRELGVRENIEAMRNGYYQKVIREPSGYSINEIWVKK